MALLDDIEIYPIKSTQGIALKQSSVQLSGLTGDRRYMLVDERGQFVTARKYPVLTQVSSTYQPGDQLQLTYSEPDAQVDSQLTINPADFTGDYTDTIIWKVGVRALLCGEKYDRWFSDILNKPVRLVYFAEQSSRLANSQPEKPVAFADSYPFLIASRASLNAVAEQCPEPVNIQQFRANIIVDECEPFAEDSWQRFKIGDVVFETVSPCVRCSLITVNPATAERSSIGEPFKTLTKQRMLEENGKKQGPTFGMNLVALNEGTIRVGDSVEVLEYRTPERY
ncbi:MOSC domain-containing protein [Reinekea thalattae]|uniref:MOSC domain-containing protein n=1 Tax=Reinekea thalattae TaxID=2593301 RepID=A0A5C8Z3Z9_9GAMM|nr:MOSC domain-containing protein [Reinekea thalattae]TXR51901.1 MOSC domain-containing protein [Reinekea thalattae]